MIRRLFPTLRMLSTAVALAVATLAESYAYEISDWEYEEIQKTTKAIQKKFSHLKDPVFIGVGRSPTVIIAQMQNEGKVAAYNLPLSGFRHRLKEYPKGTVLNREAWELKRLYTSDEQLLFQHFSNYLPPASTLRGRPVVLVDYGNFGTSLLAAKDYVEKYLQQTDPAASVQMLAMTRTNNVEDLEDLARTTGDRFEFLPLEARTPLAAHLHDENYDDLSQYGRFYVRDLPEKGPVEKLQENPEYSKLRKTLQDKAAAFQKSRKTGASSANRVVRPTQIEGVPAGSLTQGPRERLALKSAALIIRTTSPEVTGQLSTLAAHNGLTDDFLRFGGHIKIPPGHPLHDDLLDAFRNPKNPFQEHVFLEPKDWEHVQNTLAQNRLSNFREPAPQPKKIPILLREELKIPCLTEAVEALAR